MFNITVAPEPNDSRPLYRWYVGAEEMLAAGIALTEEGAWRQAQEAIDQSVAP
jgi:hypothetical protein